MKTPTGAAQVEGWAKRNIGRPTVAENLVAAYLPSIERTVKLVKEVMYLKK